MLNVSKISKKYGDQIALESVSFQLKTGKVYGFLGPNGAGKTTAMRIITGYITPDSGEVNYGNVSTKNNLTNILRQIGYLPENNPLYENMRVDEFLHYVNKIKQADSSKLKNITEECGLDTVLTKEINELSKGYKQRVGLAKALIADPDFLILDEPSTGLDPNQKTEILELIKNAGKQKTILFSSHILSEVEAIADELIIINKGEIVASGSAQDISRKHLKGTRVTIELDSPADTIAKLQKLKDVDSAEAIGKAKQKYNKFEIITQNSEQACVSIYNLAMKEKWILKELHTEANNLESLFKKLTTK